MKMQHELTLSYLQMAIDEVKNKAKKLESDRSHVEPI